MKMNRVKALLAVAMIAVLLTAAIGGTVAWLSTKTNAVENVFTPAEVKIDIEEEVEDGVKTEIVIKNVADQVKGIPAYVRVSISGNYVNDSTGAIEKAWSVPDDLGLGTDWLKIGNYYYYAKPVAVGDSTSNLIGNNEVRIKEDAQTVEGAHLEVTVLAQAVQSEPTSVVANEWGVALDASGNIIGAKSGN